MNTLSRLVLVSALGSAVVSCAMGPSSYSARFDGYTASYNGYTPRPAALMSSFGGMTYEATDRLLATSQQQIESGSALLVASLVNVDDMEQSSTFGRMVAEQASGRLAQRGYLIREPKLRETLAIRKQTGELMLSRDLTNISKGQNAQAVVTGTYAVGGRNIFVNLRLIAVSSGQVLSAVDYQVPLNGDTRRMIYKRQQPPPHNYMTASLYNPPKSLGRYVYAIE